VQADPEACHRCGLVFALVGIGTPGVSQIGRSSARQRRN